MLHFQYDVKSLLINAGIRFKPYLEVAGNEYKVGLQMSSASDSSLASFKQAHGKKIFEKVRVLHFG